MSEQVLDVLRRLKERYPKPFPSIGLNLIEENYLSALSHADRCHLERTLYALMNLASDTALTATYLKPEETLELISITSDTADKVSQTLREKCGCK